KKNNDIAGVIMEATGGSSGTFPMFGKELKRIRKLTEEHGVVLIFDEIITGFRISPGGAQKYFDVIPDLTCLGKILCGGLPGAAVAGKKEIMEFLETKGDPTWDRYRKIRHFGTQNASPLSAAAGLATLEIISQGEVIPKINALAQKLREKLNEVIELHGVRSCVYGFSSIFHTLFNHNCPKRGECDYQRCDYDYRKIYDRNPLLLQQFWNALINKGIDTMIAHGTISSAHSEEDLNRTVEAFDYAIAQTKALGLLT
ncbi:MAG: aminotransferase class III-fold pyridoxal phosphate-dependent enzyme, partial [Deltaproteobacteria bacterium]|nr:aminotransferase class III-fold pyridoxal phosphate-dependent enzyme [Deltaproteobacteria bacterium]